MKKNPASRGTSGAAPSGPVSIRVVVRLPPGALRVGELSPGATIECSPQEAIRLVDGKGFRYADPTDAQRAADYISKSNAAAPVHADAAATVAGAGGGTPDPFPAE